MTARKLAPLSDAEEARIQEGIRNDPENPEWTEADFAAARPFAEVFPELAASIEREGLLMPDEARQQVAVPLDPDVIAKFKATGAGWEARINEVLRNAEP